MKSVKSEPPNRDSFVDRSALTSQNQHGGQTPDGGDGDHEGQLQVANRVDIPKMYRVLVLNDDFTPMDFVVLVLRRFFGKNEDEATRIMLEVHKSGAGMAGLFTLEIAEMKVMQTTQFAQSNQYPLKATFEEDN